MLLYPQMFRIAFSTPLPECTLCSECERPQLNPDRLVKVNPSSNIFFFFTLCFVSFTHLASSKAPVRCDWLLNATPQSNKNKQPTSLIYAILSTCLPLKEYFFLPRLTPLVCGRALIKSSVTTFRLADWSLLARCLWGHSSPETRVSRHQRVCTRA